MQTNAIFIHGGSMVRINMVIIIFGSTWIMLGLHCFQGQYFDSVDSFTNPGITDHITPSTLNPTTGSSDTIPSFLTQISFTAIPQDNSVLLHWHLPTKSLITGTIICRSSTSYPMDPTTCNEEIYRGTDTQFQDTGLIDNQTYYYTLFPYSIDGIYGIGIHTDGTPTDLFPPNPVIITSTNESNEEISITWEYPSDPDIVRIVIQRQQMRFANSLSEGMRVLDEKTTSFTDYGLSNNTPYYYSVVAIDDAGNESELVKVVVTPRVNTNTEWPNIDSRANSDSWLVTHHEDIQLMRPRILALNFYNQKSMGEMETQLLSMGEAIRDSTRYHGYDNPTAPPFIYPDLAYQIDLRDSPTSPEWSTYENLNSSTFPREIPKEDYWGCDYEQFFTPAFATYYGIEHPDEPGRFLTLCELIDLGFVHEVWIYAYGGVDQICNDAGVTCNAAEILELKPNYDASFQKTGTMNTSAGNGGFDIEDMTYINTLNCNRTVRIGFFNEGRGPGCFLESISHGLESMAQGGSIPYLVSYFKDFGNFELDSDYGLPINSWYACINASNLLDYPTTTQVDYISNCGGSSGSISNYDPVCGNVHFAPNGREDYDQSNTQPVLTSCKFFRDDSSQQEEFNTDAYRPVYDYVNDCMGPWLMWWRQSIPGLNNTALDGGGNPMLNWWVFIYY
jgi:hypothetical protein